MVERKREGAQFEEAYQARDIDQAIKGAYPLEYFSLTSANQIADMPATPSGVWRVVIFCVGRSATAGQMMAIRSMPSNVIIAIHVAAPAAMIPAAQIYAPITLKPGEYLRANDISGGVQSVSISAAYIDVPIPGGEMPYFKPGKRG